MSVDTETTPLLFWERGLKDESLQSRATVQVQRPVYQTEELNEITTYLYPRTNLSTALRRTCGLFQFKRCFLNTVPILDWLPSYDFRKNLMGDVFSGLTVATMHIPHGLAYAILGNMPPIAGIYMGFFPVLVYCIFGSSRHVSMGTFAIVCLMTGKVVLQHSVVDGPGNSTAVVAELTPVQVATTVTFTVSVIQMIMYLFRLGVITTLLSDTLVNAFTCAAAFHVVVTQFKDLLGLPLPRRSGIFRILYTLYDIGNLLPQANIASVVISFIFITAITINNEILRPMLARKTKVPFPIELVAIVTGTAVSYAMNLKENYAVNIIGHIPTGLPSPDLPVFALMPSVLIDSFIITMVSYTVTMSLGLLVAQKHHYEVNANQELLALSFSNCFGSFFSCMPITASLSRTMIQQGVGGVTQVASLVSCSILVCVLLWIGPVFENLPRCVLASIIVVALKSMVLQFRSLANYWRLSKWDASVWIVTFLTTTIVGIDYGLLSGIVMSLISLFIQGQKNYSCLLGLVPNTELYLDAELHKEVEELPGIKIFHYSGPLNFATKSAFKSLLFEKTGFDPVILYSMKKKDALGDEQRLVSQCVILDFTALTYIDPSGVETLKSLLDDYRSIDVSMYICGCSDPVFETFRRCDKYQRRKAKFLVFPTVNDAVLYNQSVASADEKVFY